MNTTVSSTIPSPHPGLAEPSELARRLGHAGLIPFVGGALFVWLLVGRIDPQPFAFIVSAFTSYAALVVAFLGGLPWGLGMLRQHYDQPVRPADKRGLIAGVGHMVAAWIALQMPPHAGLAALGALLIGSYLVDRKCYPDLGAAGWLKLRFRLTVVASLSCFLAAAQL
ncbi:MAG: DUF3429 domain-containing protein [Rubrivivax sp.]|nr:MAG: DUF3429 domain-containing protein [Rubrivivax sp.]